MLQFHFNWKTVSVIAGLTVWNFYFQMFEQTIKSDQIIQFLRHLLRCIQGDMLLIWDRLPAHRSSLFATKKVGSRPNTCRPTRRN